MTLYVYPIRGGGLGLPNWMDWDTMDTPSRVFDQFFGSEPVAHHGHRHRGMVPYWLQNQVAGPETGMSEVVNDKENFLINLNVSQFSPEEIKVKTTQDGHVMVEGKHEERQDEHGFISRQFTRKYALPKSVDPQTIVSSLSHDGTLTIQAPKKQKAIEGERSIPIQMAPAKPAVEQKK